VLALDGTRIQYDLAAAEGAEDTSFCVLMTVVMDQTIGESSNATFLENRHSIITLTKVIYTNTALHKQNTKTQNAKTQMQSTQKQE